MSGFSTLSTVLGASILCEWIRLKDLVNLGSACNSHLTRSAFLNYCQSGTLKTEFIYLRSPEQIQWFIITKLKFVKLSTSLITWQEGMDYLLNELLVSTGSHVKVVEISPPKCSKISAAQMVSLNTVIAQNCLNVQKFEIYGRSSNEEVAPQLCAWKSIQECVC